MSMTEEINKFCTLSNCVTLICRIQDLFRRHAKRRSLTFLAKASQVCVHIVGGLSVLFHTWEGVVLCPCQSAITDGKDRDVVSVATTARPV